MEFDRSSRNYRKLPQQTITSPSGCGRSATQCKFSTGGIWNFGMFHRDARRVIEYLPLHPIPQALEFVIRTLIGILQAKSVGV